MEKQKRIRRTKDQIFYDTYEKIGKSMNLSPTQFANLVIDSFHNGTKIGKRKLTIAVVKGADNHLASVHQTKNPPAPKKLTEEEIYALPKVKKYFKNVIEPLERERMGKEDKPKPKRSKGRPKKYETEEERKLHKKVSSVNSANKAKLKKRLEEYNIKVGKDGLSYDEAVSYVIQRPEHFNTTIINLAKRIEPYLTSALEKTGGELPAFNQGTTFPQAPSFSSNFFKSGLNWGSLTKQFNAFKISHPNINSLEKFAKYIIGNKDEFQDKTIKRANFYLNVILKGKGLASSDDESSSSSSSDDESSSDESSSDEGDSKSSKDEVDSYLLGFGIPSTLKKNIILNNNIMPKFAKGSPEMKEYMRKLREMKGKGIKNHHFTTRKGDKYHHIGHHNVLETEMPYEEGGAVLLPKGHLVNKLDLSSYLPRNFNTGLERMGRLASTTMMNVPMSRTPRVINAGGVKPPPMRNSSQQRYEGVESGSKLGTAGNMSYKSLMSL